MLHRELYELLRLALEGGMPHAQLGETLKRLKGTVDHEQLEESIADVVWLLGEEALDLPSNASFRTELAPVLNQIVSSGAASDAILRERVSEEALQVHPLNRIPYLRSSRPCPPAHELAGPGPSITASAERSSGPATMRQGETRAHSLAVPFAYATLSIGSWTTFGAFPRGGNPETRHVETRRLDVASLRETPVPRTLPRPLTCTRTLYQIGTAPN